MYFIVLKTVSAALVALVNFLTARISPSLCHSQQHIVYYSK